MHDRMSAQPSLRAFEDRLLLAYQVDPSGLGMFRAFFALGLLVLVPRYVEVARFDDAFWTPPPGPLTLFAGFPPKPVLYGIQWGLSFALVALLLGYRSHMAAVLVGVLMVIGGGFTYAVGVIDHLIVAPMAAIIFAASGWGTVLSVDARRHQPRVRRWTILLVLLMTGLFMFSTGLVKLRGGWLDPSTQAVATFVVQARKARDLAPAGVPLTGWSAEPLDWLVVLIEMGFVFAILLPSLLRGIVAMSALLHFAILIAMGIDFPQMYLVYAIVLPWSQLAKCAGSRRAISETLERVLDVVSRRPLVPLIAVATTHAFLTASPDSPLVWTHTPGRAVTTVVHFVGAAIGLGYLAYALGSRARRFATPDVGEK